MSDFYVYEHWRPDTNQCFYVGKGTGKRAYNLHARGAWHKRIRAKLIAADMDVEVRLIYEGLSEEEAYNLERFVIAAKRDDGYALINISHGGVGGRTGVPASEECRKKIGAANSGRIRSNEAKRKMSAWVRTPEMRAKIGAASRGNKHMLGKKHSAATKAKLSQLGKDNISIFEKYRSMGPEASSKSVVCLDDGRIFDSASAAARHYGVAKSALIELCLGKKYRKTVGGLRFKYGDAA